MGCADQREAATLCIGNLGRCGGLALGCDDGGERRLNLNAAERSEWFSRSVGWVGVLKLLALAERGPLFQRLARGDGLALG